MTSPVASHLRRLHHPQLQDFDTKQEQLVPIVLEEVSEEEAPSVEEQLADAYQRGVTDAEAAAAERERVAAEKRAADYEAESAALRNTLMNEQAVQLAGQVREAVQALESRLAESAAAVLSEVVEDGVRQRMVVSFSETVKSLLEDEEDGVLEISGPAVFLGSLKDALGALAGRVRLQEADTPELQVKISDTRIETRFNDWMAQVRQVREG
ncbi:hypothetical protein [Roseibium sp. RKSG952]|uniref:hypothetical protein n=1 Tax=Roseibium sp. RKSG952 TaxID=2529384 RepID=UPI0012BBD0B3|nr:hypothetical protein [Roseibium sp. RKSG952]MTH98289.1 hypothetical protein [Roseibium sp. RKSG952]